MSRCVREGHGFGCGIAIHDVLICDDIGDGDAFGISRVRAIAG